MTVVLKKASSVISSFFQHTPGTQVADPIMFFDPDLDESEVSQACRVVEAEFTYLHLDQGSAEVRMLANVLIEVLTVLHIDCFLNLAEGERCGPMGSVLEMLTDILDGLPNLPT